MRFMIKKDEFAKGLAGTQAQMARWTCNGLAFETQALICCPQLYSF
jgi:hypothetical protein